MIDIGNELYTFVRNRVKALYPAVTFADEYQGQQTFPICTFHVADNSINTYRIDSGNLENAANLMVEVNVYSNKVSGRKTEANQIMNAVDDSMKIKGFTRTMCNPIPNLADATIYRVIARYVATVDAKNLIYTRR